MSESLKRLQIGHHTKHIGSRIICPGELVKKLASGMFARVHGHFFFSSEEADPIDRQPKVRHRQSGARSFVAIPNGSGIENVRERISDILIPK